MLNEELMNFEIEISKKTLKTILDTIENITRYGLSNIFNDKSNKGIIKSSKVSLKDLLEKEGKIESITTGRGELKELKKILNKNGVKFSIMKNLEKNNYHLFFQSKNIDVLEKSFKQAILKFEKKEQSKEKINNKIKDIKEKVIDMSLNKTKSKNFNHEL